MPIFTMYLQGGYIFSYSLSNSFTLKIKTMKKLLLLSLATLAAGAVSAQIDQKDSYNGIIGSLFNLNDTLLSAAGYFSGSQKTSCINYAEYNSAGIPNTAIVGFPAGICFEQAGTSTGEHLVSVGAKPHIKKVDPQTKSFLNYKDSTNGLVYTMAAIGSSMMYGGAFDTVNGIRSPYIAIVDANGGVNTMLGDSLRPIGNVTQIIIEGDLVYVVYDSEGLSTQNFSVWSISGNYWINFEVPPNSFISSAYIWNASLYLAGEFENIFVIKKRITETNWQTIGTFSESLPKVMIGYDDRLYTAGDFADVNGVLHTHYVSSYDGFLWASVTSEESEFEGVGCATVFAGDLYFGGKNLLRLDAANNIPEIFSVQFYPNPARDFIVGDIPGDEIPKVYSLLGVQRYVPLSRIGSRLQINTESLSSGLYAIVADDYQSIFAIIR